MKVQDNRTAGRLIAVIASLGALAGPVNLAPAQTWVHISDIIGISTSGYTDNLSRQSRTAFACSADGGQLVTAGGPIYISRDSGLTWSQSLASTNFWQAIASSADGRVLVAANSYSALANSFAGGASIPGPIYVSTNAGATWNLTSAPSNNWSSVGCSANGRILVATDDGSGDGLIYLSTNSGAAWSRTTAPSNYWVSVTSSADGSLLLAASHTSLANPPDPIPGGDGLIYVSTNFGAGWSQTSAPTNWWVSVASSSDGTRLVAAGEVIDRSIYISTNSGATWNQTTTPVTEGPLWSLASSASGNELVLGRLGYYAPGAVFVSTDAATTWSATIALDPSAVAISADGSRCFAQQDHGIYSTSYVGSWQFTNLPETNIHSLAASADASKLVLADGSIYVSTNSGATWNPTSAPTNYSWGAVASSADGAVLFAASEGGFIYVSTDSGTTWNQANASSNSWASMTCSADGSVVVAADNGFGDRSIYISTNSGAAWSRTTAPSNHWSSAACCSADGRVLVFAANETGDGLMYVSTNSGVAWEKAGTRTWTSVACSADARTLVAADSGGGIYTSTNYGAIWNHAPVPVGPTSFNSVACSADGAKLVAFGAGIYASTDSGASWGFIATPRADWSASACSADGNKVVAVGNGDYYDAPPGVILTLHGVILTLQFPIQQPPQPPPASQWLSIRSLGENASVSWLVPSIRSILQQNPDLTSTNWTDVPTEPALNFTNLHYELDLPSSPGSRFYRLKQQQ